MSLTAELAAAARHAPRPADDLLARIEEEHRKRHRHGVVWFAAAASVVLLTAGAPLVIDAAGETPAATPSPAVATTEAPVPKADKTPAHREGLARCRARRARDAAERQAFHAGGVPRRPHRAGPHGEGRQRRQDGRPVGLRRQGTDGAAARAGHAASQDRHHHGVRAGRPRSAVLVDRAQAGAQADRGHLDRAPRRRHAEPADHVARACPATAASTWRSSATRRCGRGGARAASSRCRCRAARPGCCPARPRTR